MTKNKTIKQQMEEIEEILNWFDQANDFDVEKATEKYQQAYELLQELRLDLETKKNQIEEL
jgi:Glu-tRNAGln amidotransferase C subunit.